MRVVVKVDTKTHSTLGSGAARYISERDRNLERELSGTRAIFNPEEDALKWRAADSYLSGSASRRPRHSNLHHIMLSFNEQDSKELEQHDPADKDRPYRLITRQAMTKIAERLKIKDARWVAGVHRHTAHPHIHLLLHKEVTDLETGEKRRLGRLPFTRDMINNRDEHTGRAIPGLINLDIADAIDTLLKRERIDLAATDKSQTAQNLRTTTVQTVQNLSTSRSTQSLSSPESTKADPHPLAPDPKGAPTPQSPASSQADQPPTRTEGITSPSRQTLISHLKIHSSPERHEEAAKEPEYQEKALPSASPTEPLAQRDAQLLGKTTDLSAQLLSSAAHNSPEAPLTSQPFDPHPNKTASYTPAFDDQDDLKTPETPSASTSHPPIPHEEPTQALEMEEISDFGR